MKRPTRDELEARIEMTVKLISAGFHDGQVKRTVAKEYNCSTRTVEAYLRRAREILRDRRNRSREDLQAESMAYYESVLVSKSATPRDRLFARKRIDELLGLEEPRRHEHSGPAGGPIKTESTVSPILTDPELRKQAQDLSLKAAQQIQAAQDNE